jgi:hypothetical protein
MKDAVHNISVPSYSFTAPKASRGPRADANNGSNFSAPPPSMVNEGMGNYFEALRESKDRTQIHYAMVHLRPQMLRLLNGLNRKLLAAVGRYLYDNGGVPSSAVNMIANYSVPVHPRAQSDDPEANKVLNDYWKNWEENCDFTNRFTLDEIQQICSIAMDTDGDMGGAVVEDGGAPRLRLYDTFHIGQLTGLDPKDGVVTNDANGKLLGFNVVDGPIETLSGTAMKFLPVTQLFLLRDVDRYSNYRGYSPVRKGSNDLRDANDIKAFIKLKEKISAALAAVIQQEGPLEEDDWGDDNGPQGNRPVTEDGNTAPTIQAKKLSLAELLGGDIPVIEGELKQLESKFDGVNSIEFLEFLAGQFVAGLDLPPAFFLDEKLTGPNIRAVLGKAQKKFDKRKAVMARFIKFLWVRVIGWGIANDGLPAPKNWMKISYQFPPLMTIDLGDVMTNERADVLVGQMSEHERFGNRGKTFEHEHQQIKEEIETKLEAATELSTKYKVPVEFVLTRLGFGQLATRLTLQDAATEAQNNTAKQNADNQDNGDKNKKKEKK